MSETNGSAPAAGQPPRQRRVYVRWSEAVAERLLARLAAGELIYHIAEDADMPTPEGVSKWARERPEFGERLLAARREGGRPAGARGPVFTLREDVADEIFERLCEGWSFTRIGADPTMPSLSTIFYWRRRFPDFETQMQQAMRIRAERFFDQGWEMAEAATPETAYVTHVQLTHLRWYATIMAPRVAKLKAVEPETPREVQTILFRHFQKEVDPETGKLRVAAYCPNPYTGQMEREDTPGWRQPGDANTFSMPGGRKAGQGYWRGEG